jgi:hypothetical protein
MNTAPQESLSQELTIERAFGKYRACYGESLTISVGKIVTPAPHKNGHVRIDVDHTEEVSLSDLEYISVFKSDTKGLCIRLVFNGKLFAVSGPDADMLELWAVKATKLKPHQLIDSFPEMRFHAVPGKVRLEDNGSKQKEIVMAYA